MIAFTRKYTQHILVALLGFIMVLLIIRVTDRKLSRINQQMQQTIHADSWSIILQEANSKLVI